MQVETNTLWTTWIGPDEGQVLVGYALLVMVVSLGSVVALTALGIDVNGLASSAIAWF